MTDYKQLCKDLAEDLGFWMEYGHSPANLPFEEDCTYKLLKRARAALAEPESPADLELRVQRLEAMRETEKAALLDAFKQIDDLKHRIDFQYWKIHQLEEAMPSPSSGSH